MGYDTSKKIFQELISKLGNSFFVNLAWIYRSFLFSSFNRKVYIKIHKLEQWVKFEPRFNARPALNN